MTLVNKFLESHAQGRCPVCGESVWSYEETYMNAEGSWCHAECVGEYTDDDKFRFFDPKAKQKNMDNLKKYHSSAELKELFESEETCLTAAEILSTLNDLDKEQPFVPKTDDFETVSTLVYGKEDDYTLTSVRRVEYEEDTNTFHLINKFDMEHFNAISVIDFEDTLAEHPTAKVIFDYSNGGKVVSSPTKLVKRDYLPKNFDDEGYDYIILVF